MDDRVRRTLNSTDTRQLKRPVSAPGSGYQHHAKNEQLRNRVESQLRARINETKMRSASRNPPTSFVNDSLSHNSSLHVTSNESRHARLRKMLEAYSFSSNAQRNKSTRSQSPPPVLRRRLDRPGRPIVKPLNQQDRDSESSESPVNFRRIHRRLMPPRPNSVSMIQRHKDTTSLNSTFNIKSQTLRSRLADLSQTMRVTQDKSSSSSPPPVSRRRNPLQTMKLIEDIRRRAQEISRGSSMWVDESNMPSIVIPREAPETPVQHSRETFVNLNHMSRSIRELHPSSPRAVSPANWMRDHHSSLLVSSPSPSVSSVGLLEDESAILARRKEQARLELEKKQRELVTDPSLHHYHNSDHAIISLESLNVVSSSVRSLSELIRAKEAEIEAKKSVYISRKAEADSVHQKQIEYLKHLEQEEARIERETMAISLQSPLPIAPPEEVSVPPLPSPQAMMVVVRQASPSPSHTSVSKTPEIFNISSPVRLPKDISCDVSPVNDEIDYEKLLGMDSVVFEQHDTHEVYAEDLMMSPPDDVGSHEFEDLSVDTRDISMPDQPTTTATTQHLFSGEAEGVFTLSVEEERCSTKMDTSTTAASDMDELADLVISSVIESLVTEHFVELECSGPSTTSTPKGSQRNEIIISSPPVPRIDSFDVLHNSSNDTSSDPVAYIDSQQIVKAIVDAVTNQIWVRSDELLTDAHLNHIKTAIDYGEIFDQFVPCSSVAACIADAFLVLVDSIPPAMAAEREWQMKFPGSHSPLAGFLPARHSLASLTKGLSDLINAYNRSVSSQDTIAQVESLLSHEYLKKSKCDEILFQCNDSDMWTRFDSNTCSRAEAEILDEVSLFVFEAIVTSVASDFQHHEDVTSDVIYTIKGMVVTTSSIDDLLTRCRQDIWRPAIVLITEQVGGENERDVELVFSSILMTVVVLWIVRFFVFGIVFGSTKSRSASVCCVTKFFEIRRVKRAGIVSIPAGQYSGGDGSGDNTAVAGFMHEMYNQLSAIQKEISILKHERELMDAELIETSTQILQTLGASFIGAMPGDESLISRDGSIGTTPDSMTRRKIELPTPIMVKPQIARPEPVHHAQPKSPKAAVPVIRPEPIHVQPPKSPTAATQVIRPEPKHAQPRSPKAATVASSIPVNLPKAFPKSDTSPVNAQPKDVPPPTAINVPVVKSAPTTMTSAPNPSAPKAEPKMSALAMARLKREAEMNAAKSSPVATVPQPTAAATNPFAAKSKPVTSAPFQR